jgi:alkanesulfonate monooxygenase
MKLGLHLPNFTFPNGPAQLGNDLITIAKTAEDTGFDRLSVMDHLFQIQVVGPAENAMLEAYTALGFLAAHTSRVKLYTLVTAATYREPGVLAKAVTTLDVLSGGRAMLGIGAGWNEEEVAGLGLPFGPTAERFERLEETLQICLQMWSDSDAAYEGKHYQLGRTLNSPQALSKPHPPILIGGGGEKKTLRLVAKYAQACNIFGGPEVEHKLNVLREHCQNEGTDYDAIEKTVMVNFRAERAEVKAQLEQLAGLGVDVVTGWVLDDPAGIEEFAKDVVPFADGLK